MKKKQMYELIKKDFAPTDNTDNIGDKKPVPLEDKATSIDRIDKIDVVSLPSVEKFIEQIDVAIEKTEQKIAEGVSKETANQYSGCSSRTASSIGNKNQKIRL